MEKYKVDIKEIENNEKNSPKQDKVNKAWKREGIRVILGGVMIHLVLGTFYIWGGISLYIASYLKSFDSSVNIETMKGVFPFMNIAINSVLSFGIKLSSKIGHKKTAIGGICVISLTVFTCSFVTNMYLFIFLYAILVGISTGLIYMVPVICGWSYFPNKRGAVSGIIVAGYGFGSFTFNLIAVALVNPNNEKASVEIDGYKYFSSDVYDRVPMMFRILSLCYLLTGLIGACLVKMPTKKAIQLHEEHEMLTKEGKKKKEVKDHEEHLQECHSILQGLKTRPFWLLMFMVIFGAFFGLLMANNYKVYGLEQIDDDQFMSVVGSVGAAVNGFSRAGWALALDRFGFKKIFFIIIIIQSIVCATLDTISESKALYLIWYAIIMCTEGGIVSMSPAITRKVFGARIGPLIYGFIFFGFAVANLSAFMLTQLALDSLQWSGIFWVSFALTVGAGLLNIPFAEKYKF